MTKYEEAIAYRDFYMTLIRSTVLIGFLSGVAVGICITRIFIFT